MKLILPAEKFLLKEEIFRQTEDQMTEIIFQSLCEKLEYTLWHHIGLSQHGSARL